MSAVAAAGAAADSPAARTGLGRAVYRDHPYCFTAMSLAVGLQLIVALK
jgi:hypothetical protein